MTVDLSPARELERMTFGERDGWLREPDDECSHGRLPTDRTPACGCWPQEVLTNPTFTEERPKVEAITATHPDRDHAPYGLKADGTPRKRPAPAAHVIEAARQAKRQKAEERAANAAEPAAPAAAPAPPIAAPAPTPVKDSSPMVQRFIDEVDDEIARLYRVREALLAVAA